jgi:glutathione peroxidase
MNAPKSIYELSVKDASGKAVSLDRYRGKPMLIVNVASQCGLTPHYAGLEMLYKKYGPRGLAVVGFPCNQFGAQEPGTNSEIQEFCQINYGVTFPVMGKVDVNGASESPVYTFLKSHSPGANGPEPIKWNFAKFLVDKDGRVFERFAPTTEPQSLEGAIEKIL